MNSSQIRAAALVAAACVAGAAVARQDASGGPDGAQRAAELVARSVDAALAGDSSGRRALVEQAIAADPESPLARAEAGQMRVGRDWVHLADAQRAAADDPRVDRHRLAVEQSPDTPEAHSALGRACQQAGLIDEARFHWAKLLLGNIANPEARRGLGLVEVGGMLMPAEAAADALAAQRALAKESKGWAKKLRGFDRDLARAAGTPGAGRVLAEIRAIDDPAAIPAFEAMLAARPDRNATIRQRRREIALAFVAALDAMPGLDATESLVRQAVLAPETSLRAAAIDALVSRPKHESVPYLVDALRSPMKSEFQIRRDLFGRVAYTHAIGQEGQQDVRIIEQSRVFTPMEGDRRWGGELSQNPRLTAEAAQIAATAAGRVERLVAAENLSRQQRNERIGEVLGRITGETFGDDATKWWSYWDGYNGVEPIGDKPVLRTRSVRYDSSYANPPVRAYPPVRHECFAAGTDVWTKTGKTPIEKVRPGEVVLSRDTRTGELVRRAVIATTIREPSAMIRVVGEGFVIRLTDGHPVWVVGQGWRMAKELSPGEALQAIDGPRRIVSVAPAGEERAYNLIVEGTANYFAGPVGVLSHDNTPRRPRGEALAGMPRGSARAPRTQGAASSTIDSARSGEESGLGPSGG